MLDQNTNRFWYIIGGIILSSLILYGVLMSQPDLMNRVQSLFTEQSDRADSTIVSISGGKPYVANGFYTKDQVDSFIDDGYIPIANSNEFMQIEKNESLVFGLDTDWEDTYLSGLDQSYIQVQKIDFTTSDSFEPIVQQPYNHSDPFAGVYDGGGLEITHFHNQSGDLANYALFGYSEGTVQNVRLTNVSIEQSMDEPGDNIAGLVAINGQNGLVKNSMVSGSIITNGQYVGGLVGKNYGMIEQSYSLATVEGSRYVGVLAGLSSGRVVNSYAKGHVKGGVSTGGLVGELENNQIIHSYSASTLDTPAGSLLYMGGLAAVTTIGDFVDSYYDKDLAWIDRPDESEGLSTNDMLQSTTYKAWDTSIWLIEDNKYPRLHLFVGSGG